MVYDEWHHRAHCAAPSYWRRIVRRRTSQTWRDWCRYKCKPRRYRVVARRWYSTQRGRLVRSICEMSATFLRWPTSPRGTIPWRRAPPVVDEKRYQHRLFALPAFDLYNKIINGGDDESGHETR